MFGIHDFGVFLATGIILNLTPGQDTFYILGRSISQGRSAGMPQFITADSPNKFLAFITLGLCFMTTGTLWCFCLAWFASRLSDRLRSSTTFAEVLRRTTGALFIFLGIRLAATK